MRVIIIIGVYIALQMISDITSLKIITLFSLSMDADTLFYPLTFTVRDIAHKILGHHQVRYLIILAAVINIFMALSFYLVSVLPADQSVGEQLEFSTVLSPIWRITFASILAEVISELLDTELYSLWVSKLSHKYQWGRVLFSNSLSVPVDSLIFCVVAFYGVLPNSVVWSILVANVLIKLAVTVVSVPLIYVVKDQHTEESD